MSSKTPHRRHPVASAEEILDLLEHRTIPRIVEAKPERNQAPDPARLGAAPGRDALGHIRLMIFGLTDSPLALSPGRCRAIVDSLAVLSSFAGGASWRHGHRPNGALRVHKTVDGYAIEIGGEKGRPLRMSRLQVGLLLTLKSQIAKFARAPNDAEDLIL